MRIISISDTHGEHWKLNLPEGDVLVHSGDFTKFNKIQYYEDFNNWLGTIKDKFKKILVISGNHEVLLEQIGKQKSQELLSNCTYMFEDTVDVDGIKFYGSPWQPEFFNWAFNLPRGKHLIEKWKKIPDNTNVLITHGPPMGIRDECPDYRNRELMVNVGCEDLYNEIVKSDRLKDLKVCYFGHIHYSYGTSNVKNIDFINSSIVNELYIKVNEPIIYDLL